MAKMRIKSRSTIIDGHKRIRGEEVEIEDMEYAKKLAFYGIAEFLNEAETQDAFLSEAVVKNESTPKVDFDNMSKKELFDYLRESGKSVKWSMSKGELLKIAKGE